MIINDSGIENELLTWKAWVISGKKAAMMIIINADSGTRRYPTAPTAR
jgi:hypothetical protein